MHCLTVCHTCQTEYPVVHVHAHVSRKHSCKTHTSAHMACMQCTSVYFTTPLDKCSLITCTVQTDHSGVHAAKGGSNVLLTGLPQSAGWLMESMLTFLLVFVVFAATDHARAQSTAHLPILAPAGIGFAVFVCHIATIPIDGTSINRELQYIGTAWFAVTLPECLLSTNLPCLCHLANIMTGGRYTSRNPIPTVEASAFV